MSALDEALREAIREEVAVGVREALADLGVQLHQPDTGEALRPKDVAALLGVHRNTVYSLVDTGELPAERIGRSLVIRRSDVEALIAANRNDPLRDAS